jgi:NADPH-dependent 2,4-dienoyl-CoA reductase/sulfur reductase-like enzyme/rhodanese-related sulfurtransferase
MDHIHSWLKQEDVSNTTDKPLHCVIAGGGFIGLEMVEQLARKYKVTLVEMAPQILAPFDPEMVAMVTNELKTHGVEAITGDGIAAVEAPPKDMNPADEESYNSNTASVIVLQSGRRLPASHMTLISLGVRPDTAIVKEAGIATTARGHIIVDEFLHTSASNVWAVGDAIEVVNPILDDENKVGGEHEKWTIALAGPANRQGRMVADNIYGFDRKYRGTYGASVLRVFNLTVACVGMNEKMLATKKVPYDVVHVHPGSHAGYYPGAKPIHLKLLFCPYDGKIYGAQAIGEDGIDKRIDVISTAMQGNLTVHDLANLELCYAPPVGSAKDPVNIAGMAAEDIMDGLVKQIDWSEMLQLVKDNALGHVSHVVVLDVRNPGEIASTEKIFPSAINIPLNDLRSRLNELPSDKDTPLIVSCMSGQRAYYACRILIQNGYTNVRNLGGAFKTFSLVK